MNHHNFLLLIDALNFAVLPKTVTRDIKLLACYVDSTMQRMFIFVASISYFNASKWLLGLLFSPLKKIILSSQKQLFIKVLCPSMVWKELMNQNSYSGKLRGSREFVSFRGNRLSSFPIRWNLQTMVHVLRTTSTLIGQVCWDLRRDPTRILGSTLAERGAQESRGLHLRDVGARAAMGC